MPDHPTSLPEYVESTIADVFDVHAEHRRDAPLQKLVALALHREQLARLFVSAMW